MTRRLSLRRKPPQPSPAAALLSRRSFLRWLGASAGSAALSDGLVRSLLRDRPLLADAAEIVAASITLDMHCHANTIGGGRFPQIDSAVPENMKAGGVDCGIIAARGDYPVIRRDSAGQRFEQRPPKTGELFERTNEQIDHLIAAAKNPVLAIARSPEDVYAAKKAAVPAAMLAIEGGDPLEGDLSRIQSFYDRGVRVIQLMHFRINEIGDIQTAAPKHNGLTSFGLAAVLEMNRVGMIIDTAHCAPATLHGVLRRSRQPVILSHTGPAALRKRLRHLDDDGLLAVAKQNGIVGVWPALRQRDTFENFLQAIEYVQSRIGVEHVGIGTDVHGLRGATAVPSHRSFPLIAAGLLRRGHSESDVAKIIGGNCMRLFHQVNQTRSK